MAQTPTITIPASTADKLAALGRALIQLSQEIKQPSGKSAQGKLTIPIPDLTRPVNVPEDEEWFWSPEWQAGEREVNAALKRGDYQTFDSVEELINDLHHRV